jgi:[CysO sulfur-carrier protein]-S-L-cysteine hydrolase
LTIYKGAIETMIAHARAAAPGECCGLLIGSGARIDEALPARNVDPSPKRFQIDPQDHFNAIHAARESGREIVGVYHSHPSSPAQPSASDIAEAIYTEYAYVIVGLAMDPPEVRLFRFDAGAFTEEPMRVSSQ